MSRFFALLIRYCIITMAFLYLGVFHLRGHIYIEDGGGSNGVCVFLFMCFLLGFLCYWMGFELFYVLF
jgi:hypothetical protein